MKNTVITLVVVLALCGCTSTRSVVLDNPSTLSDINRRAQKEKAGIRLLNPDIPQNQYIRVNGLHIAADSSSWWYDRTGRFESVATSEIESIVFVDRGTGALEGFVLGLLDGAAIGAASGALIGYAGGDTCDQSDWQLWCSASDKAGLYAAALGMLGGGLGALGGLMQGASSGHRDVYRFERPKSTPPVTTGTVLKGLKALRAAVPKSGG